MASEGLGYCAEPVATNPTDKPTDSVTDALPVLDASPTAELLPWCEASGLPGPNSDGPLRHAKRRLGPGGKNLAVLLVGASLLIGALLGATWPTGTRAVFEPRGSSTVAASVQSPSSFESVPTPISPKVLPPVAAPPTRLSYPALGLDLPITPLTPSPEEKATQSLVPPITKEAYWLTNYGRPGTGSTDTTYLIGHSWTNEDAPFNHIGSVAKIGDQLTITTNTGEVRFTVTSVDTYSKSTLKDSPIWNISPGSLVLVTCYLQDPEGKNVVVRATAG